MEQPHTHFSGPLCEGWADDREQPWCQHHSCLALVHEPCRACEIEAMMEAEAGMRLWKEYEPLLSKGLCPIDLTAIGYPAVLGAPGYGNAYHCRCNHTWYHTGSIWDTSPRILGIGDVR